MSSSEYSVHDETTTTPTAPPMHAVDEVLRTQILDYSKQFKISWLDLAQSLYAVWRDKLYQSWQFEKFEDYVEKEVGLKKNLALKLVKSYNFIEEEEPRYLDKNFITEREPMRVPSYEELNVLRSARGKRDLTKEDYQQLRQAVFEKGRQAADARKDLTAIMKERKPVDPDEEREKRSQGSIKKLISTLKDFKKDMSTLQLIPDDLIEQSETLAKQLEEHLD